jgi:hypothetical protein
MTPDEFLKTRQAKAQEQLPTLNQRQIDAIMGDERAIEQLDFRDRDDLIVKGLARRCKPDDKHPYWRTWITLSGLMTRAMFEISKDHT